MATTREIRGRIKAVGNIKRITKTMQLIATARFQKMQRKAVASQPYTKKIAELVGELASNASSNQDGRGFTHPLLAAPASQAKRELLLVLTSNRGLCGAYNGSILREATKYIKEKANQGITLDVQAVGKKGINFFRFTGQEVAQAHTQFGDDPAYDKVEALANQYMQQFTAGKYDTIKVIYMAFKSMSRQSAKVLQLLPMSNPASQKQASPQKPKAEVDYDFSPDPKELLNELLPVTVRTQLYQSFNESVVSEQIARMIAMKSATDNATKMGKELAGIYNRARQTAITTELMEVISGAAALE